MCPVPCLRNNDPVFDHETPLLVDGLTYDCRVEFTVADDDTVTVQLVDVWMGTIKHGRWMDTRDVFDPEIAEALYERAADMPEALFDAVSTLVEDRRAEIMRNAAELLDINADDLGHARRERIAERRLG